MKNQYCQICKGDLEYFFTKSFNLEILNKVDYLKCNNCGFVKADTICKLNIEKWNRLNNEFHSNYQYSEMNIEDLKWVTRLEKQSKILKEFADLKIINLNESLDYGCGDAKLSKSLKKISGYNLLNYDKYMTEETYNTQLRENYFNFLITTSVFEHIVDLRDLDNIVSLINENGVMAVHTLITEKIPRDPNWFYLYPVHVSFFTNKSMEILFNKWGFKSSLYHLESQLWFFFKENKEFDQRFLSENNLFYKDGFMDYWHVKPYRRN
ncbi:methyltransferase domain-containing protein [Lysinibacillus agricola]|uniref:Methyltransferase domain-containing protein n=1 Tax=Lysinibacillus agricola TaxID=2590012 RepID=A0ABX7ATY3_9BACI|nr:MULTISPECIES: methyltransferase domain-containing protein [Lysinibacillus]KOS60726.1 hypothetical protein AN161_21520 [Lysinibacillus sp. FJAT-14222]QQP13259.1 methyltransferase domain-containing protein [Lysinibacillus agricola]